VALLFERVEGFRYARARETRSGQRTAWPRLLGREPPRRSLGREAAWPKLLDLKLPGTFAERLGKLNHALRPRQGPGPRRVTSAPCQEVVEDRPAVRLRGLPALQCWPGDGGRYITLPAVFTARSAHGSAERSGMYRLQVFDEGERSACTGRPHKGGAEHHRVAERGRLRRPRACPVAIALGGGSGDDLTRRSPRRCRPGVDEVVVRRLAARGRGCRARPLRDKRSRGAGPRPRFVLEGVRGPRREAPARGGPSAITPATTRSRRATIPLFPSHGGHPFAARPIYPTTIVGRPPAGGLLARQGDRAGSSCRFIRLHAARGSST